MGEVPEVLTQSTVCARVRHWSWQSSRWARTHRRNACNALHPATYWLPGLWKEKVYISYGLVSEDGRQAFTLQLWSTSLWFLWVGTRMICNLRAGREARNWTKQWEWGALIVLPALLTPAESYFRRMHTLESFFLTFLEWVDWVAFVAAGFACQLEYWRQAVRLRWLQWRCCYFFFCGEVSKR